MYTSEASRECSDCTLLCFVVRYVALSAWAICDQAPSEYVYVVRDKSQKKRLDAFNTKTFRRIMGDRWYDYVMNASILTRTVQPPLTTTIRKPRGSCAYVPSNTYAVCNPAPMPSTFWPLPHPIMAPPERSPTTPLV